MLREGRGRLGVTQATLAERMKSPQSMVSKVESGERRLDFPEFMAWAGALGLDVHAFVDEFTAKVAVRALPCSVRRAKAKTGQSR